MLVVAAATLGRHHVRGRLRAGHRPRPAPAGRRRGRGPVRRRAGHLGAGRPSHRDGQHCLRGRRALQLTPWAVRRARRFCTILAASIGLALVVSVAKIPVIGILVAASVTGGFGTTSAVLLVRLARDPQNHVTAAHHPAASHRGLGRHGHRQQPRPARHSRRGRRHVLTSPAHDRSSLRRADRGQQTRGPRLAASRARSNSGDHLVASHRCRRQQAPASTFGSYLAP